jgi:hypothetical protein
MFEPRARGCEKHMVVATIEVEENEKKKRLFSILALD